MVDYIPRGITTIKELYTRLGDPPRAEFATALAAELADDVLDRFLRYVRIDTQSTARRPRLRPRSSSTARLLRDELEQIGLDDVRLEASGYVYGSPAGAEGARRSA